MENFGRYACPCLRSNLHTDDPYSILTGGVFRFLPGEVDIPLVVHVQALKISRPLYNLATGPIEDARLGYTTIPDIEVKIMQLFIEYAYTGLYRTDTEMADKAADTTKTDAISMYCTRCRYSSSGVRQRTPFCAKAACRDGYLGNSYIFCINCGANSMDADCAYCEQCRRLRIQNLGSRGFSIRTSSGPFTVKASNFTNDTTAFGIDFVLRNTILGDGSTLEILSCRLISSLPQVVAVIVFARKDQADTVVAYLHGHNSGFFHGQAFDKNTISAEVVAATPKQIAFEQRKYGVGKIKHKDFSKNLKFRKPFIRPSGDILAHAKLWVFADRYLINDLKDLCLHMLHRELLVFKISESSVLDIFELLSYVYDPDNIRESDEDIVDNVEEGYVNELEDLVISYAACIINELREFKEYRETLRNGGDLAADLGSLEL